MDALRMIPCLRTHGRLLLGPSDEGPELEPALAGRLRQGFARGVSARKGEVNNREKQVVEKYRLRNVHLYEGEEWIRCHAGACGRDGLAWLQPATVVFPPSPWTPFANRTREFLHAAVARDSLLLAKLAAFLETVRWAFASSARTSFTCRPARPTSSPP